MRSFHIHPSQAYAIWVPGSFQSVTFDSMAICRDLSLSSGTVKIHTSAALRALNVTTRTQAVIAAGRMGLHFDDYVHPRAHSNEIA